MEKWLEVVNNQCFLALILSWFVLLAFIGYKVIRNYWYVRARLERGDYSVLSKRMGMPMFMAIPIGVFVSLVVIFSPVLFFSLLSAVNSSSITESAWPNLLKRRRNNVKKPIVFSLIIASMSLLITGCSDNRTATSSNSNKAQINLVDGVYSAYYNDYNELSLNLTDNLTEINENLKWSEEETSASIQQFINLIEKSDLIKVP